MLKLPFYKTFLLFVVIVSCIGWSSVIAGTLSCSVTTSCPTGVVVMRFSGTSNAHVELASQLNYTQIVCCSGVIGLSNLCAGTFATALKLSGTTNAHSEQNTQSNYGNNACLSVPVGSSISIDYQANNCAGYDTTLGSISAITNAHAGDSSAYTTKICGNGAGPIPPSISGLTLNSGNDINLNESSYRFASTSMLVTDVLGCSTITSVTAKAYLASSTNSGTLCNPNDRTCYPDTYYSACSATTTGNTCTGGPDTSVEYDCGFKFWYIATPTDAGSPWATSIWSVAATATDALSLTSTATNTGQNIEVNSLLALDISPTSINYGTLEPGQDTGLINQSVDVINTGNVDMDPQLKGDSMTSGPNSIAETYQQYLGSTFTYGIGVALSSIYTTLNLSLSNPVSTTTSVVASTYWGLQVPLGRLTGTYTGLNYFQAVNGI